MPLFQLLVLCMLASKRIDAAIAMGAAQELFAAGLRTPRAVLASDRHTMIAAFGRVHFVRYDESSATRLAEMAERAQDEFGGDLREIAHRSDRDPQQAARILKEFRGHRATAAAKALKLTTEPAELSAFAPRTNARLASALVRASLDAEVRLQVTG